MVDDTGSFLYYNVEISEGELLYSAFQPAKIRG